MSQRNGIEIIDIITKKNTQTVKRYMLHYKGEPDNPLKIEISFRNSEFLKENQHLVLSRNGINVYDINTLSSFKIDAFLDRYAARDIFDIAFLLKIYPDTIGKAQINALYDKCKSLGVDYLEKRLQEDSIFESQDYAAVALSIDESLNQRKQQLRNHHKTHKHDSWYER